MKTLLAVNSPDCVILRTGSTGHLTAHKAESHDARDC